MRPVFAAPLLLVLVGCAAFGRGSRTDGPAPVSPVLHEARMALVEGRPDEAAQRLERAMRTLEAHERALATLLLGELRIQQDRPDDALDLAEKILAASPDDPAAHEVAGKALLKAGRYDAADEHFSAAMAAPGLDEADRERLEDLSALGRGLAAYARSDPDVARNYWNTVEHPKLRFELDQSVRDETAMGALGSGGR